jgi:two-component system, sensor histidine kinase and response regulator
MKTDAMLNGALGARANELFEQHQQEVYRKTDQLLARLMFFQWLAGIAMALVISPRTWAGQSSQIHLHVWLAIFCGGAISVFPIWMTRAWPGAALTRYVIAVAQMLMSALLISVTGGRIETHFHVFGSLVILSFYRDWRVLIPATIVVGLDHLLRGIYWPYSVYGVLTASPWRSVEHAAWVMFEDIFLVISCLRNVREMRLIANRTAALEDSEESFRKTFEKAPIGMAVVDLNQRFLQVNATFCKLVGYSEEELTQGTTLHITLPEDITRGQQIDEALLNGAAPSSFEKRYLGKNGQVIWVARTACLIRDAEGKPQHYLVMVQDITERRKAAEALLAKEKAESANKAKSEFLSRMSHELRTPLNAILGFGQLMERQNPTDTQRARLSHITSAGRHLLKLINEVLDISRIEAGHFHLSLEPMGVADALQEMVDLIRPLAAERGIDISSPSPADHSVFALADPQRFKQVLLNLLSNAVKYSPVKGKVTVSYISSRSETVRIVVSDTGVGIPGEKLARLFIPFDRLGAEQSNVEGTGLGLALSQRLIQAMDGSIGVQSVLGQGSTFWVELPRAESPLAQASVPKSGAQEREQASGEGKRTILYIEDDVSNATLVEEILSEQPEIKLISAMQAQLGLDLARKHLPDLILLDLNLPDLPGWEVLAQLRRAENTRDIPVVVISADASASQIKRLINQGARDYLTKPLDINKFSRIVAETTMKPVNRISQRGLTIK